MCAKQRPSEVTHETIANRLGLARTTVTRILNNDPTYRASKLTREKVLAMAAELGYNFANLRRIHRRRFPRRLADVEAHVRVVFEDGTPFDQGECRIKNISLAGALLADLRLSGGCLPLKAARVYIDAKEGYLKGIPLWGVLRRCSYGNEAEVGIAFEGLESSVTSHLSRVLEKLHLQPLNIEIGRWEGGAYR